MNCDSDSPSGAVDIDGIRYVVPTPASVIVSTAVPADTEYA